MCIPNMFSTTVVMATSNAGSDHWSQLHHVSAHPTMRPALARRPPVTDSVVVTTTTNTRANYVSNTNASHNTLGLGHGGGTGTDAGAGHLPAVDGRIGKSGRKRSRASRRAPTTLLNTDTKNFRAMVQQFTGFSSSSPLISPALDVSTGGSPAEDIGFTLHQGWPSSATGEFYQQQQQQHREFVFPTGHDQFFHMFNNQQRSNAELSDGYLQSNISTQMMMRQIQGEHTNSHGYFS